MLFWHIILFDIEINNNLWKYILQEDVHKFTFVDWVLKNKELQNYGIYFIVIIKNTK